VVTYDSIDENSASRIGNEGRKSGRHPLEKFAGDLWRTRSQISTGILGYANCGAKHERTPPCARLNLAFGATRERRVSSIAVSARRVGLEREGLDRHGPRQKV